MRVIRQKSTLIRLHPMWVMSEFTEKKAQNLIDTKCIIQIDDDTYQVNASTPGRSYIINDEICECMGFKFRGECSHVIAVKMLQKLSAESELVHAS